MDKVVLAAKLESLRRCVGRIEQKRPCWSDLRAGEPDIQDIIVLNLTRAVQLCVDIGSHIVSDSELPVVKGDRFIYPILTPPMSQPADQFPYGSVGAK